MFAKPNFRIFRAGFITKLIFLTIKVFFVVFGFFGVFPIPHMIWINGFDFMWPILWRELLMGACYVVGAVIYSARIPGNF
jgi:predicted membrane channel-forming protein YqfA (hemolysin III family)